MLYGATSGGGSHAKGTLFKLSSGGLLTSLMSFTDTNGPNAGAHPTGLLRGRNGMLYGTTITGGTHGKGTAFMATTDGALTTLGSFTGSNGANPYAQSILMQAADGNVYGTTRNGGSNNYGTVFKIAPNGALSVLASFDRNNGANPYPA